MIAFPNCKINLGLYVTARRDDGYHDLETVFYPVALRDVLEIVPAKETTMQLSGKKVAGNNTSNLVWKAYELLKAAYPEVITPVSIYLHKHIPMGAGLGGGSADGAYMLVLLKDYFNLDISEEQLIACALQLGSDCPFFIRNTPQYASGRGEVMEPVAMDLSSYSLQLVCPQVHIATAAAFKMIQPKTAAYNLKELAILPIEQWSGYVTNDFELPVFQQHPELSAIKDQLYEQGALYAAMSGSGSTLYGIMPKGKRATITSSLTHEEHYIM